MMKRSNSVSSPAVLVLLLLVGGSCLLEVTSFQHCDLLSSSRAKLTSSPRQPASPTHDLQLQQQQRIRRGRPLNNFFKDLLDNAFDNDPRFSDADSGKRKGQIDAGFEDDEAASLRRQQTTLVQEQWRQRQQQQKVTPDLVVNTKWTLDLFLAGVPSRDPSNDLFASRENISNRDKALGIQIPDTPTLSVDVTFLPNQQCQMASSDFTTDEVLGQWKLSDDGKQLRFSIQTLGYSRTVETKGSIQSIYGIAWKRDRLYEEKAAYGDGSTGTSAEQDQPDASSPPSSPSQLKPTSSVYSIPPGWVYADVQVAPRSNSIQMVPDTGVLRLEQPRGWIGSVMVPCGKFAARLQSS